MLGRIVTEQEIIDAIHEMMFDDVRFDITPSGGWWIFREDQQSSRKCFTSFGRYFLPET
jgi:hypothetical protein